MTEQEARELIAKALEADGWPNTAAALRNGDQGPLNLAIRVMLRTSDLELRALEACEAYAEWIDTGWRSAPLVPQEGAVRAVGRESIAAKKPKGPWRVMKNVPQRAAHNDGRDIDFWMPRDPSAPNGPKIPDQAACAEWVREQNEREAAR